jgi:type II secretory pathway pseudopilin PulG
MASMVPHRVRPAKAAGFTYIGILIFVAFIGVGLAVVGQLWSFAARRANEEELLFVGDSFRDAIRSYYTHGGQLPQSLEDLVKDPRSPATVRYIRKLYADPITRTTDWRLITLDSGGIVGVASKSTAKPIKVANFPVKDAAFEDAECYCEWEFVFATQQIRFQLMRQRANGLNGGSNNSLR